MRFLGIDPGDKNIGVAISDPTGTLARPLTIFSHANRREDAQKIVNLAEREKADRIIIGQATDMEGKPNYSGRKAARLAAEIRSISDLPVELWDESFSTQKARKSKFQLGAGQKSRQGHHDEIAAAIILQSYLDTNPTSGTYETKTF
jgi:putative Holliday junction resolvase